MRKSAPSARRRYYYGGNNEPAYTKTFTYYLDSGMVYETFTQTRRVYT